MIVQELETNLTKFRDCNVHTCMNTEQLYTLTTFIAMRWAVNIVLGHTEYSEKICLILRAMKVRVKEGPCGELRLPKSETLNCLPSEKRVSLKI